MPTHSNEDRNYTLKFTNVTGKMEGYDGLPV